MKVFLPILVCLQVTFKATEGNRATDSHVRFLCDFVTFNKVSSLTLIESGISKETSSSVHDRWSAQLASRLVSHCHVYITVVMATSSFGAFNGTTVYGLPSGDSGVALIQLRSPSDLRVFEEMFTAASAYVTWLLFASVSFPDILEGTYIPIDRKVIVSTFTEDGSMATLWETYQVTRDLPKKLFRIGRWTRAGVPLLEENDLLSIKRDIREEVLKYGVMVAPVDDPIQQRVNLTGLHLRCAALEVWKEMCEAFPLLNVHGYVNEGRNLTGIEANLFQELAARTNFTYTCRPSRDRQWGLVVDGKWTGIVRDLLDDVADIGIGGLANNYKRSQVISYLLGTVSTSYDVYMKRPTLNDQMWSVYTKQFSLAAWVTLVLTCVALAMLMFWTTNHSPSQPSFTFLDSGITVVGFILGQGTSYPLVSVSCRLVTLACLVLQVLLLAHYSSDLVSSLSAGPPPPSISSLQDVSDNPSYQLGYMDGTAVQIHLSGSRDPALQKIWKRIVDNNFQSLDKEFEDGMQRVLRERYLFMEAGIFIRFMYDGDCRYYRLPTTYFQTQIAFMMQKKSPYVPVLNKVVLDILSTGLMQKWYSEFADVDVDCSAPNSEPIGLRAMIGPFFVLGVAMAMSLVILGVEILKKRSTTKLTTRERPSSQCVS